MLIFVKSQVLYFPLSSLKQIYEEASTWRTNTGVEIPSAERLSVFLGFTCEAASHLLSELGYRNSNSPDELELIRWTFEYLLEYSARGTKVESKELMDILSLFKVRSDALGHDWVLDLLTRILEQQPAPVSQALTRRDYAGLALINTHNGIGQPEY